MSLHMLPLPVITNLFNKILVQIFRNLLILFLNFLILFYTPPKKNGHSGVSKNLQLSSLMAKKDFQRYILPINLYCGDFTILPCF